MSGKKIGKEKREPNSVSLTKSEADALKRIFGDLGRGLRYAGLNHHGFDVDESLTCPVCKEPLLGDLLENLEHLTAHE